MSDDIGSQSAASSAGASAQSEGPASGDEGSDALDMTEIKPLERESAAAVARLRELVDEAEALLASADTASQVAEASAKAAFESQTVTSKAAEDAEAWLAEIGTVATQATAASTKITDDQAVIATKSDHIQKAQDHADKVRADLDRQLTAATQQATDAEGLKSRAQSAADKSAELLVKVQAAKGQADAELADTITARDLAESAALVAKGLADKSAVVEERVAGYEKRLAELESQCAAQLKTIESLLPGATSAGLARAFDERRESFTNPHRRWQWVFVGSLTALVLLALTGLFHAYFATTAPTYDELVRLWLLRLPVAAALVWLALHASHESALAKRLEEDYGYKSAIAQSFEGFRKQMLEIAADVPIDSPVGKLAGNTLTTIATPPGRIYDKHELHVSPTHELTQALKLAAEAVTASKPA